MGRLKVDSVGRWHLSANSNVVNEGDYASRISSSQISKVAVSNDEPTVVAQGGRRGLWSWSFSKIWGRVLFSCIPRLLDNHSQMHSSQVEFLERRSPVCSSGRRRLLSFFFFVSGCRLFRISSFCKADVNLRCSSPWSLGSPNRIESVFV